MDTSVSFPSKECTRCHQVKPLNEFNKRNSRPCGYTAQCKACARAYSLQNFYKRPVCIAKEYPEGLRLCKKCKEPKPYQMFYRFKWSSDGFRDWCKECCKIHNAQQPDSVRKTKMLRKYKLTIAQYDAMLEAQNGVCAICKHPERGIDPRTNAPRRLAVDHNHETGQVRELLCYACNAALGAMKEDPERIRGMLAYAEKWK